MMLCLPATMSRKKILAVQDSATTLPLEKAGLGRAVDVTTAGSGEEILGRARADRPDLVLIDSEMPELDWVEACRRLRSDPDAGEVPIILVTSHSEAEYLERAFISGCTDYVIKPVNENELLVKVRSYLGE
jgi:CheY-like chemotaxis protein